MITRFAILICLSLAAVSYADDATPASLDAAVLEILRQHFPDAELARASYDKSTRTFAVKTRTFVVYRPLKTGEWQKGSEEVGPDMGGFMLSYHVRDQPWGGALMVPHTGTTDMYIFQESYVVMNTADGKRHIWARIATPRIDAPVGLRDKLMRLFVDFAKQKD